MQCRAKFESLSPWQKLLIKVKQDNPHLRSNRQRMKVAREIWLQTRPVPSPKRKIDKSKWTAPEPVEVDRQVLSEWQKHYREVYDDNPQLKTTKAKYQLAKQLWLIEHSSDDGWEKYLNSV